MRHAAERRTKPRARTEMAVRLGPPGDTFHARIRDISTSGVCCLTDRALPVMTQVRLVLCLPAARAGGVTREIACQGAVVRSEPVATGGRRGGTGPASEGRAGGPPVPAAPPVAASGRSETGFDTAIFFTDMRESDLADLEDFVTAVRGAARIPADGPAAGAVAEA